jgi:hypothetical protein
MGFQEQSESHESKLLLLTSLELIAIIVTTIVQIGCLKKLIDNRTVV